ncbi:MAG: LacI family DNA-binding transcriptional regulator [Anaerolineae bacterium]
MTKVTLKDIARESGYSVTTVSRALGGFNDVNEQTRAHIMRIARELGYQPNLIARQLQSRRTFTIGMVIPASERCEEDDFFATLLKGVTYTAAQHHYDVLVSGQLPDMDEMDAYRTLVGGNRVDGMIVARTQRNDRRIRYLKQVGHPFVVAGRSSPDEDSDFPYIDADSQEGIARLVAHFVAYGHTEIGLILPPEDVAYTAYRHEGYKQGLAAAGLPYRESYVAYGDLQRSGGYQAALDLLARNPAITAIIACNDLMAFGVMQAIHDRGLRIGEDVAVGGFDDIPAARHTIPPLTTVRQPICEIGGQLTEMLLQIIEGQPPARRQIMVAPELIIRESSGKPRR